MSPKWTEDSHETQYSSIQYDFRVTCDTHYYGTGCADLCRPRDDQFGHYTCSATGSIVCLAGWQGDYCTKRKYKNEESKKKETIDVNVNGILTGLKRFK